MKLKLNENVCKCLALIVLSAIVGMVVYRQTQAKPVRSIETYVGTAAKDPSHFICILPKNGGGFVKCGVNLTDGTITTQQQGLTEIKATNKTSASSIIDNFRPAAAPAKAKALKVIPTENPLIKYVGPLGAQHNTYIKVNFNKPASQEAYKAVGSLGVTLRKTTGPITSVGQATTAYTSNINNYYTLTYTATKKFVITKNGSSTTSITITTKLSSVASAYLLLCNNDSGHEPNVIALFYPSKGPGQYSDNKFPTTTSQIVKAQTLSHSGAPKDLDGFKKYIDICAVKGTGGKTILHPLEPLSSSGK